MTTNRMKWFNFLIKFLMPFWIVTGTLGIISRIITTYASYLQYSNSPALFIFTDIVSILLAMFMVAFLFLTWRQLKIFTVAGYRYAIIYFALTILMPSIVMLLYAPSYISVNESYDLYNLFVETIVASIICIPNMIYIKKRKNLFSHEHEFNPLLNKNINME